MTILEFKYTGLLKVISGGQTGTDYAGLVAAKAAGIKTGGFAPLGWRTSRGIDLSLKDFGLIEHSSSAYKSRTLANVFISDGTLIVASNVNSPGTVLTISACKQYKKPVYIVLLPYYNSEISEIAKFIVDNNIKTLNVAGNRDLVGSLHYDATVNILAEVFLNLRTIIKDQP